jgi:uncharacterized protein YbjT (DUF2867 family)
MIIVTGATGKLGRLIVEQLLTRVPASRVGVSVRDPDKAQSLAQRGVRVCHGDFDNPHTLSAAFDGASQVLVVSSNARAYGGDPSGQQRAAIETARAAGARRIVYTSHMGVSAASAFAPMHDHAVAEAMLRDSGLAWTALRNGFYASTVPMMVGDAVSSSVLAAPRDGKVSWTAHRDLAAAAVAVLLQEGRFEGPTPPLTASQALDLDDVAAILADIHGKPVRRETVSDEDYAARMAANGAPPAVIDITLSMYRAARAGEFAAVDPTLASLLGRAPAPLRDVLAAGSDG